MAGGSLDRFTAPDKAGLVTRWPVDERARAAECTGCVGKHRDRNTACYGAAPVGPRPPVLDGRATELYRFGTGEYMGEFTYEVIHTWPYSTVTVGRLVCSRP